MYEDPVRIIVRNGEISEAKRPLKNTFLRTLTYTDFILRHVHPFTGGMDNPALEMIIPAEWKYLSGEKFRNPLLQFVILTDSNLRPTLFEVAKSSHLCYTTRQ